MRPRSRPIAQSRKKCASRRLFRICLGVGGVFESGCPRSFRAPPSLSLFRLKIRMRAVFSVCRPFGDLGRRRSSPSSARSCRRCVPAPTSCDCFCYCCSFGATTTMLRAGDEEVRSPCDSSGSRPPTRNVDGGRGKKRCFFRGPCLVISFLCCDLSPRDILVTAIEMKAWDYFWGDGVVGGISPTQLAILSYASSDGLVGETNLTKYFASTCRVGSFSCPWLPSGVYRRWQ